MVLNFFIKTQEQQGFHKNKVVWKMQGTASPKTVFG